jgi:hypothetical protein
MEAKVNPLHNNLFLIVQIYHLDNSLNDSLPLRPLRNPTTNNGRRYRSSFNAEQIEILEQTFAHTPYPDVSTRERLSQHLNIEDNRIQVCRIFSISL